MIETLPWYWSGLFVGCVLYVLAILFRAYSDSRLGRSILSIVAVWLVVQGLLGYGGFYRAGLGDARFMLLLGPPALAIGIVLFTPSIRRRMIGAPLMLFVWIHVVRIPVEMVLWGLFQHGDVPRSITFEGTNFDVLTGVTAPLVVLFAFRSGKANRRLLISWHIMGLALLANVVVTAVLSTPVPFQQLNFDQPNVGMQYFPFVWLPSFVVPAVLFAHVASLVRLCSRTQIETVKTTW